MKERAKDKEKCEYSSFYFNPLFVCEDSLFKGFQKELLCAEFKIPCSTLLFDDEVSHVKKENKDEVPMEECKTLILSSNLNDEINSYCTFICASNHAKSFVLMPKEELYIKDQWERQFGEEVDVNEDQGNHWEKKILHHLISRSNVLIEIQPVLILEGFFILW